MKFAIIGGGNTGQAAAAYLVSKGGECTINTRSSDKAQIINQKGITAEGAVTGTYPVAATTDMAEAIKDSELILVMTVANGHHDVATLLKDILTDNQKILIFNSNWGALEFKKILGQDIEHKNLTVAETGAQLFLSSSVEPGQVNVALKEKITVSATDSSKTQPLIDEFKDYFPQFVKVDSIIETTMSTTNPIIHVPIALVNGARIENGQPFLFYAEGATPTVVDLIVNVDKERVLVAKKLGYEIDDVLTGINSFWEIKHDNLFDALTKNPLYIESEGPTTIEHRYFTEDIPYGIVPIAEIGKLFNIDTPYTNALIDIIKHLYGQEFVDCSIDFVKEDFK